MSLIKHDLLDDAFLSKSILNELAECKQQKTGSDFFSVILTQLLPVKGFLKHIATPLFVGSPRWRRRRGHGTAAWSPVEGTVPLDYDQQWLHGTPNSGNQEHTSVCFKLFYPGNYAEGGQSRWKICRERERENTN